MPPSSARTCRLAACFRQTLAGPDAPATANAGVARGSDAATSAYTPLIRLNFSTLPAVFSIGTRCGTARLKVQLRCHAVEPSSQFWDLGLKLVQDPAPAGH